MVSSSTASVVACCQAHSAIAPYLAAAVVGRSIGGMTQTSKKKRSGPGFRESRLVQWGILNLAYAAAANKQRREYFCKIETHKAHRTKIKSNSSLLMLARRHEVFSNGRRFRHSALDCQLRLHCYLAAGTQPCPPSGPQQPGEGLGRGVRLGFFFWPGRFPAGRQTGSRKSAEPAASCG